MEGVEGREGAEGRERGQCTGGDHGGPVDDGERPEGGGRGLLRLACSDSGAAFPGAAAEAAEGGQGEEQRRERRERQKRRKRQKGE